jgi:hypothetical protein
MAFMKKLRADLSQGMLAIIWCRILCIPVGCPKIERSRLGRAAIFPVVLYACEAWSLTLREERRLRLFENRVLRKIFGPKGDEVTREWRRLHNEKLYYLYSSPYVIRVIKSRRMPRRHIYFVVVVRLAWSDAPESYAGGSVATGRAYHAAEIESEDPDKKGYPGPPGCGLGHEADNFTSVKTSYCLEA